MTTQAFSADAVNLFVGTAADALNGSMTITMKTARYYIEGTRLVKGQNYTVTRAWGKMAIEQGWASDTNQVFPVKQTPQVLTGNPTIVGTGDAAVDYKTLVAAIAGLPSTGGSIHIEGVLNLGTNTVTVDRPVLFYGDGSSDGPSDVDSEAILGAGNVGNIAASVIVSTSTTGILFQINSVSCSFQNIHLRGPTTATAGAAIVLGAAGLPANGFGFINASVYGFWKQIVIVWAPAHNINFSKLYRPVNRCLSYECINGSGDDTDSQVIGNTLTTGLNAASPFCAVYWESGGGVKFIGNKINRDPTSGSAVGFLYGWYIAPKAGIISGVILINDNSIENTLSAGVYITSMTAGPGGGSIGGWVISNNEWLNAARGIEIISDNGGITRGYIGGNVALSVGSFIYMNYAVGIRIGPNDCYGVAGWLTEPMINIANGVDISYKIEEQTVSYRRAGDISIVKHEFTDNNPSNAIRQGVSRRPMREMPALNLTPTAVNIFKIDIGANNGNVVTELELQFNGSLSGPGAHISKVRRIIYGNGAGTAAVATPSGWSDYHFSPNATTTTQVYLTWGFTIASGIVTITVTAATGVGTPVLNSTFAGIAWGDISLTINGPVREFIIS